MRAEAERYVDLARLGRNAWWRYALGVLTIAGFWIVLGQVPYLLLLASDIEPDPLLDFVAVNFSIFMMLAGLAVAVKLIHRRPFMSLVSPGLRFDWRRAARAARVWLVIGAVVVVAEHLLYPGRYYVSFDAGRFFVFMAAVLLLTPVQAAAEELVFRGYLLQGFGLVLRRPLAIAAASSIAFTLPHMMNPEVAQHGAALMAANYLVMGVLFALVTLRDGRLELAIGLHAVNNVFLALVANYEGSALATESVFTATELDPVYSLITLTLGGCLFYWWIFRRAPENPS